MHRNVPFQAKKSKLFQWGHPRSHWDTIRRPRSPWWLDQCRAFNACDASTTFSQFLLFLHMPKCAKDVFSRPDCGLSEQHLSEQSLSEMCHFRPKKSKLFRWGHPRSHWDTIQRPCSPWWLDQCRAFNACDASTTFSQFYYFYRLIKSRFTSLVLGARVSYRLIQVIT